LDLDNQALYIAMAGQHQVWRHKISEGITEAFSGDGYERNLNGRRGSDSSFAQPSGLSLAPGTMVFSYIVAISTPNSDSIIFWSHIGINVYGKDLFLLIVPSLYSKEVLWLS
jgi:hypothetical protein